MRGVNTSYIYTYIYIYVYVCVYVYVLCNIIHRGRVAQTCINIEDVVLLKMIGEIAEKKAYTQRFLA